jgi:uncharacterized membrane-anchored protein
MTRGRWLAVVVALQAAYLLAWAGYHEWTHATGRTVLLESAPVDPRDLLRGDYMVLRYKISDVAIPWSEPEAKADAGQEIWVALKPQGKFHVVETMSWTRPTSATAGLVVRGRVRGPAGKREVRVDYGIEKYFVPEGMGQPQFKEMVVEATVSARGELAIKRLLLDGKAYP